MSGSYSSGEPIKIVSFDERDVLYDGYHRVADALLGGNTSLRCVIIKL